MGWSTGRPASTEASTSLPSTRSVPSSSRICAWGAAAVSRGSAALFTTAGVEGGVGTAARMGPVVRLSIGTMPPPASVAMLSGALMPAYSAIRARSRSTSSAKVDFMYCIRSLRLKMLSEVMRKRCSSSASSLAYW